MKINLEAMVKNLNSFAEGLEANVLSSFKGISNEHAIEFAKSMQSATASDDLLNAISKLKTECKIK